jgi:hypothetical protein
MQRYSIIRGNSPTITNSSDDSQEGSKPKSHEEVFTPDWSVIYEPDLSPATATVRLRPKPYGSKKERELHTVRLFSMPLYPLSMHRPWAPGEVLDVPAGASDVRWDVSMDDPESLVVQCTYGASLDRWDHDTNRSVSSRGTIHVTTEFWMQPDLPVVRRIEEVMEADDGYKFHFVRDRRDFVECGGQFLPRSIVHASRSGRGDLADWFAYHWSSSDLGEVHSAADAFVLQLGEGTVVRGLSNARQRVTNGRLDCSEITAGDLDWRAPRFVVELDLVRPPGVLGNTVFRYLLVLVAGAVLIEVVRRLRAKKIRARTS